MSTQQKTQLRTHFINVLTKGSKSKRIKNPNYQSYLFILSGFVLAEIRTSKNSNSRYGSQPVLLTQTAVIYSEVFFLPQNDQLSGNFDILINPAYHPRSSVKRSLKSDYFKEKRYFPFYFTQLLYNKKYTQRSELLCSRFFSISRTSSNWTYKQTFCLESGLFFMSICSIRIRSRN